MKLLPFIIQKLVFRSDPAIQSILQAANTQPPEHYLKKQINDNYDVLLMEMPDGDQSQATIPGYFVMSNAPPNIEESVELNPDDYDNAQQAIQEIVEHLYHIYKTQDGAPELVISVHGYNTDRDSVEDWYRRIFKYINHTDKAVAQKPNKVFIGYRWPSEQIKLSRFWQMVEALPRLPLGLLIGGMISGLLLIVVELSPLDKTILGFFLSFIPAILVFLASLILALVILRLVVYFRDNYRATNFGVPDLVELLRLINDGLITQKQKEFIQENLALDKGEAKRKALEFWHKEAPKKVHLSFIGHSMGGFVVTNTVRILSDVFDTRSVDQEPPPDIGSVFYLERLVLASPDIPVLTIMTSRANFLAASLRRFDESYLFSNEGDIALRLASTAANYIAFPSKTQEQGYRLGNVAIKPFNKSGDDYGMVNLLDLDQVFSPEQNPGQDLAVAIAKSQEKVLDVLFVSRERFSDRCITLAELFTTQPLDQAFSGRSAGGVDFKAELAKKIKFATTGVANFFTYFDCTDYKDYTFDVPIKTSDQNLCSSQAKGILTRACAQGPLNTWDYLGLILDYARNKRDVHGGYFQGQFSQELLYRLAFLGFKDYLTSLGAPTAAGAEPTRHTALQKFHETLKAKGIQGFLSPLRYQADILGTSREDTRVAKRALQRVTRRKDF